MADFDDLVVLDDAGDLIAMPRADDIYALADLTPPTVSLVSPIVAPGQKIAPSAPIVVDVSDDKGLAHIFVWVWTTGGTEVVYADGAFQPRYQASAIAELAPGRAYRLTIRRDGGWPSAPTIKVTPVDFGGATSP